jgi:hypothetical protein
LDVNIILGHLAVIEGFAFSRGKNATRLRRVLRPIESIDRVDARSIGARNSNWNGFSYPRSPVCRAIAISTISADQSQIFDDEASVH